VSDEERSIAERPSARARAVARTWPRAQLAFAEPHKLPLCAKREERKRVLHALKKTGRRGQRRPKYTRHSDTKC